MDMDNAISDTLKEMGYADIKDKQREAIVAFLQGRDVFVVLPTGYGKSLIYAMLPLVFDKLKGHTGSIAVVISPLTSIMMDQTAKYSPRGLTTEFVGESQVDSEATTRVLRGLAQLVFISPESIIDNPRFRNMLLSATYKEKLVALVVDEAHCVKNWGDEFRVAFARIGELRSLVPTHVNIMALTATATNKTLQVVSQRLCLRDSVLIALPPNRPNIQYKVQPIQTVDELSCSLSDELRKDALSFPKTVLFCQKYLDCSELYRKIRKQLGGACTYPLNYPDVHKFRLVDLYTRVSTVSMREKVLTSFATPGSTLRLVIATTAFGMGVDCKDIRRIIHWGLPSDVEQYVQETGRAGRDGLQAEAILQRGKMGRHSTEGIRLYMDNDLICRRKILLEDFIHYSSEHVTKCVCCDICCKSCTCMVCVSV